MDKLICINARFLTQEITGVQRFAIEISRIFAKSRFNVMFLAPSKDIKQVELLDDLNVTQIGYSSGYFWEQVELPLYLKKNGSPILVNLMSTAPILYPNKVYTLHDITFIRFPQNFSWKFRTVYKILVPLMLKTSKKIVTVSKFSKKEISGFYNLDDAIIDVVYNGVKKRLTKPLDNNIESEFFLTVSSPSENKNLVRLIQGFTRANLEGIKLVIVGGIDTYRFGKIDLLSQIENNDSIVFTGRLSDDELDNLYRKAKGFVFPSIYEGFGIPPLEAQSLECPVLLSNIDVFKEVYGDSVHYCDPYDINDIGLKLKQFNSDIELRENMVQKGIENVEKYSWSNSVDSLQMILSNIDE